MLNQHAFQPSAAAYARPDCQSSTSSLSVGAIMSRLAAASARPRFAYMVLSLVIEVADSRGQAGPFVDQRSGRETLRNWLADTLAPTAERDLRRQRLRERVRQEIAADGGDAGDEAIVAKALAERVRAIGRANVSRAVSDLVKAGLVRRHYVGWVTDHRNRGGRRHAAYTVEPEALAAMRRTPRLI